MAKMAGGQADDLASTVLLATDPPVLVAPAMNPDVGARGDAANLETLKARRGRRRRPQCRRHGGGGVRARPHGRAAWRSSRRSRSSSTTAPSGLLAGKQRPRDLRADPRADRPGALPRQPLLRPPGPRDCQGAADAGAAVTLVSGPVAMPDPAGVSTVHVETRARDAASRRGGAAGGHRRLRRRRRGLAAGRARRPKRLKKSGNGRRRCRSSRTRTSSPPSRTGQDRPRLVVGFAAETEQVIENARSKLAQQGLRLDRGERRRRREPA